MQNNNQNQIAGAVVIAGLLIAGAVLLKDAKAPPANEPTINKPSAVWQGRPVSVKDHIFGNRSVKIMIVEYSDLECPYCKMFHETMHKVIENESGNVAWVYRHYPIPQLHPKAPREAEAAECAYEQGGNDAFWKYVDRIFAITPSNNRLEETELTNAASYVGLNVAEFNSCLSGGKYTKKVQADIDDGVKAGVNGTPSSFILVNGKLVDIIPGAQPYETVIQMLSQYK